ncbi:HSP20-like chaperone [Cylindrobasidium torrendii FP15055 ss-10]|uniref:HSP20-like chaperone n=1 Tax=Cylindrobasidium torrendii FP15055 ss-10 TaxID=1314674 RepID=A0A0D7B356_9AGAR|nr:HSP20-like chaperone [Cylindrobasidium torrendii FP15055 ss-10]
MASVIHPEVLWAQRSNATEPEKNVLYVTINVPDIVESELDFKLTETGIHFAASNVNPDKSAGKKYAFDLDFFAEIDPEKSSKRLNTRDLALILRKKDLKEEYWPRLTKEKVRNAFIKTDFSKWADEDEQDETAKPSEDDFDPMGGAGGMPPGMANMMGGGGMPGMGGGPGGNMDFEAMMQQMQASGLGGAGGPSGGFGAPDADDSDDDDDDGPPPLEDAEPAK